jgi:phosphoribosylamine--glycine ligase
MRVLVVGSGGREHALSWAIAASPLCDRLYAAPGNAGIAGEAECVPIAADDVGGLVAFAKEQRIEFVVVGPEAPLVLGLVDRLEAGGIPAFGPSAAAAALEGSKGFMKDLARRYAIPTAAYGRFTDATSAKTYVTGRGLPIVIKADGLAAGKGVVIAQTSHQAGEAIDAMIADKVFGAAGAEIVIEEFLEGEELSFFALVDGKDALALASAQDHKRVGEGDTGPNTGGMGAYSPAPACTAALEAEIMGGIIRPTVAAMAKEGRPFKGVLYAGLMLTEAGPKLLEYNVRFGDPETQSLLPLLETSASELLFGVARGGLCSLDRKSVV